MSESGNGTETQQQQPGENQKSRKKSRSIVASWEDWHKVHDTKTGRHYYFNNNTRQTQWKPPEGWVEGPPRRNKKRNDTLTAETEALMMKQIVEATDGRLGLASANKNFVAVPPDLYQGINQLLSRLSSAVPQLEVASIVILGGENAGKSKVLWEVFGVNKKEGERVSDTIRRIPVKMSSVVIYSVRLPEGASLEDSLLGLDSLLTKENGKPVAIWNILDSTQQDHLDLCGETVELLIKGNLPLLSKLPIAFVLNKIDIATDEQKQHARDVVTSLEARKVCCLCECAAAPKKPSLIQNCCICGSGVREVVDGRHQCGSCHGTFAKETLKLTSVVVCTMETIENKDSERLVTAQQITIQSKFVFSKVLIAEYLKSDKLKLRDAFLAMALRMAMLWGLVDASPNSIRNMGVAAGSSDRRSQQRSCTTGNYSSFVRWLQETLQNLEQTEKEYDMDPEDLELSQLERQREEGPGSVEAKPDIRWRHAAEGISLCRSLANAYIEARQMSDSLMGSKRRSQRVSMQTSVETLEPELVAALERALLLNGLDVAFEQFIQAREGIKEIQPELDEVTSPTPTTPVTNRQGGTASDLSSPVPLERHHSEPHKNERQHSNKSTLGRNNPLKIFSRFWKSVKGAAPVYFGANLTNVPLSNGVPVLFKSCLDFLYQPEVIKTEGLFRIPGNAAAVHSLRQTVEEMAESLESLGGVDYAAQGLDGDERTHVIAGLFKEYLRELEEPVIPFSSYGVFVEMQREKGKEAAAAESVRVQLAKLPEQNRRVLTQLTQFLHFVSTHEADNRMTAKNLAVCFAPDVLRAEEEDLTLVMRDMPVAIDLLHHLIEDYPQYFSELTSFARA